MNKIHIAFLFSILLLFPGCVSKEYYKQSVSGERTQIDFSQPEVVCPTGDCVCMTCGTVPAPEPYSLFYNFSYAGKTCSFNPCNQDQYLASIRSNPNGEYMNFFMLGQGGFGDFGTANPFCNNSLRMPVKWLDIKNSEDGRYPLPEPDRATCFLEKGAIPVYILYSGGESIDTDRAREIAALFNGKGPVIITTEMGFDSSTSIAEIEDQAKFMKSACPNCLIALAPRVGDNSSEFDQIARDAADSIDLFAFGISSRNSSSCDSASLYYEAVSYSEQLLYKYKKPSILAYVLFDKGWNDARTCFWDDSLIASAYADFYTYAPAFPSSGIIGVSLYSLSGVGSLQCEECGLLDSLGNPTPSQPAWFSQCQQAYASKAIIPLVFSDAPGTSCIFGPNSYNYAGTSFYTQAPPAQSPASAAPAFYKCDACAVTKESKVIDLHPYRIPSQEKCTLYPMLDSYADIRDLDPAFVRATAWMESDFTPCAVSKSSTMPCGRITPMYSVSDPDGNCPTYTAPSGSHVCAMGLMQTEMPPQNYWEDIEFTSDILGGQLPMARTCAPDGDFNPFNPAHSACHGTFELSSGIMPAVKHEVSSNEGKLGLSEIRSTYGEEEYETDKGLITLFIARLYYAGGPSLWTKNAYGTDGWLNKFQEFSQVDDEYCSDHDGKHVCCDGDHVKAAYRQCCGKPDFINFVANEACIGFSTPGASEDGRRPILNARNILSMYMGIRKTCGICDEEIWEDNLNAWAGSAP